MKKKIVGAKAKIEKDIAHDVKEVFAEDIVEPKERKFTLENQIEDILDVIGKEVKDIDEITQVSEILSFLNERLNSKRYSELTGEWLSRAALKLSILNVNIGSKASEASMGANMGYGYRKFQYASEWKATKERISNNVGKVTNEDVKSELEVKNWVYFKREMEQKLFADRLIALNHSIDSLLVAIGYRLKMLMNERMVTKYQS